LPVHVCGEAYSQEQGWVEGALQTAEIMLTKYFSLPPRAWPAASDVGGCVATLHGAP